MFQPYATGPLMTISRTFGGGDGMCEWDTVFAVYMVAMDAPEMAYSALIEVRGALRDLPSIMLVWGGR
jgi:hypothetical protein